ncbi:hypothetical protein [Allofranklinella schreckenbergeri]|uniref:hypothetical protein n=1 Tax=Allofranklinella schreckenbergeri TaxID=1076744 RepID=UPI0011C42A9B|nr:hypothetical protein [Allofranklinella schreckenbergeri]
MNQAKMGAIRKTADYRTGPCTEHSMLRAPALPAKARQTPVGRFGLPLVCLWPLSAGELPALLITNQRKIHLIHIMPKKWCFISFDL